MKKILRLNKMLLLHSLIILIIVVSGINFFAVHAKAAELNLPFNTKVEGFLTTEQESVIYKFQLTKAGRVTIDVASFVDSRTYIKLSDEKNTEIFDDSETSSSNTPAKYYNEIDLEAGVYFLEIYDGEYYYDHTGKFNVLLGFSPANNNELEPNNGTVQAQPLPFNTIVNGFLSWNDAVDVYKISVPKSGRVSIDLSSFVDSKTYVSLIDDKNNEVIDDYINSSSINPASFKEQVDLEPGTYYLKVYDDEYYYLNTGKYQLKVGITLANSNDKEPNNGTVNAQPLAYNLPTTGFLAWNDSVDVYKLTVPKAGRIYIDLTSYIDTRTSITLLDSYNREVADESISGSSSTPGKFYKYIDLNAGTYYLKIEDDNYYAHTGKYILKVTAPHLLPPLTIGLVSDKTTVLSGKTSPNLLVTLKVSGKEYKKSSDSKGNFNFSIPKQRVGSKIEAYVTNSYGTKKLNVTVVDKTSPGIPAVNSIADNHTVIKGKTEPYAFVYAKVGTKQIGYGKANVKGEFTIKIPKQKSGVSINVFAKDKAGNIGPSRVLKVLDKTAPTRPAITKVFPKITGKAEKGSTVYIYNGKKLLGKQTVTSKGTFTIKITSQKKGSVLKVYARDKAGNNSVAVSIKVK